MENKKFSSSYVERSIAIKELVLIELYVMVLERRVENFNASLEYFIANYKAYSALNCSVLRIPKERNAQHPKKYLSTRYSIDFVEASDV